MTKLTLFDFPSPGTGSARGFAIPIFTYLNEDASNENLQIKKHFESWFTNYPKKHQSEFRKRFRSVSNKQHYAVFFELLLHELLINHGYSIELHPEIEGKSRSPDFKVSQKAKQFFYLEATTSTFFSESARATDARINKTIDELQRLIESPNFWIHMSHDGGPKSQPSAQKIASQVNAKLRSLDISDFASVDYLDPESLPGLTYEHDGWRIWFEFSPKSDKIIGKYIKNSIGSFSTEMQLVDHRTPIKRSIDSKANAYGKLDGPYIIAVNAQELVDDIDISEALFGRETWRPIKRGEDVRVEFAGRSGYGAFHGKRGPINRRVSAVLVVSRLKPWSINEARAELFHNPWALKPLPTTCLELPYWLPMNNKMTRFEGKSIAAILNYQ